MQECVELFSYIKQLTMKQENIPKVNSVNLWSVDHNPMPWDVVIMDMINKSEDGSVIAPLEEHTKLKKHIDYLIGCTIHSN